MSWDDEAGSWDDNPAVRAYAEAAFESLEDHLAAHGATLEGARVLDFGCGTGLLTVAMAERAAEVVGLDLSPAMVEVLRAKAVPKVRALAGALDAHELGRFDLVTCSSVCGFLEDHPGTVATLARHLRPGGWLVQWDWELDPSAEEPFGLSRAAIREALAGAGLVDVVVRTGFEKPFEGMVMAPLLGTGRVPGSPGAGQVRS